MSEPSPGPSPYRIIYSEHVREEFRRLLALAIGRGLGAQVAAAAQTLHERLRIYPQFGEPLQDLELKPAQVRIGCIPPLVVKYWLNEDLRTVIVGGAIVPLPRSGLDP